ncbi:MAG: PP2C family protein-serine/threonine phosphatase, partial [Candidatus Aminicenantes bacterium]|nr:PP2C family protein-serine/threonine phosphatase [Candidatus Aminicenantes bacterium]
LDRILDLVVQKSLKHMKAEQGAVLLLDEKKEEKPFQTMIRGWDTTTDTLPFRLDTQLTGWMLKNRQPLLINNLKEDRRFHTMTDESLAIRSLLCVPLILKGHMIGLVSLFNKKAAEGFSQEDQRLLSIIAAQSTQIIENARLLREEQELIKIQEELRLAYDIQTNLLPEKPPAISEYDIFGKSIPAKEVGGDYFDFIPLQDNQLVFCLGDVSGKGMGAALLMANLQATIRGQALLKQSITHSLDNANRLLFNNTSPEKFATLFYGCLDYRNHELRYCNAGHNLPFLFSAKQKPLLLKEGGMIIGCMESVAYEEKKIPIKKGDTLVIYSDGITEAINSEDHEFSEKKLERIIEKNQHQSSRDLIETIISAVTEYTGDSPQTDDMTLMIIKRMVF